MSDRKDAIEAAQLAVHYAELLRSECQTSVRLSAQDVLFIKNAATAIEQCYHAISSGNPYLVKGRIELPSETYARQQAAREWDSGIPVYKPPTRFRGKCID